MSIQRLEITNLRNLQSVSLQPDLRLNLFTGANGSGKSSLLEAIHLLGLGRSFRSGRARRLVNDAHNDCTVFAVQSDGQQSGIQRSSNGETAIKLNGSTTVTMADMAQALPLLLLDPESMDLLDQGSKPRRAQLDWGLFHVEPQFYPIWLRYQRGLKQRNSLLRSGSIAGREMASWHKELGESARRLHSLRLDYLQRWLPHWESRIQGFLPDFALRLDYSPGWDVEQSLEDVLADQLERDRERGHTQQGPHRADLRVRLGTAAADEVLSRGQKKLVVCALKLSQASVLREAGRPSILLIDDLASELDGSARERLIQYLVESEAQVFMTAIEAEAVTPALDAAGQAYKLFHVEQGSVSEAR